MQSYLKGNREESTAEALALGGAVHKTLEEYYLGIKDGKIWEIGEARGLLNKHMDDYDIPFSSEENKIEATEQHTNMIDGLVLGTNNLYNFLNECEVVDCEKDFIYRFDLDFEINFNGSVYTEIYIVGSIDMIVKNKDGGLIAIDFKSGRKAFDNNKIKKNLQLPIYSLVINDIYGRLPEQTLYYFTRLDEFQSKPVIKKSLQECECVFYKTGKRKGQLKSKDKCIDDIYKELMDIFVLQYATGAMAYKPNSSPLCSWCDYSKIYGDNGNYSCNYAMLYERKDIEIPKDKEFYFTGKFK